MRIDTWRGYAKCFSTSEDERRGLMAAHLSPAVVYRDPTTEVRGRDAFAAEMARMRAAFPDHTFEVDAVDAHHDRSIARWRLLDADGNQVTNGLSHGVHDVDGRLVDITGFYPVKPITGWQ